MPRSLTVAFLWHMHQPFYVDLASGRATLPWVRLHALKDYVDVPRIARRFPALGQTFNLVPCLLDQIEGYRDGSLTDTHLDLAARDARELTREDRLFLLREFFSYNPGPLAARLPRLEELRRKRGARPPESASDAALAAWRETDFRDLQVLFHLAWSGAALSARPEIARLVRKGRGFTQEELDRLLAIQRAFLDEVVPEYRDGAREGTIEISASPYYHPILPLLCDTDSAREACPRLPLPSVPFRHPEDARHQVRSARAALDKRFGAPPAGMWPSEGAISGAVLTILGEEGVRWAASDEEILFASLDPEAPQSAAERSRLLHRPWIVPGGTVLFFRDHFLSDRIGFVYASWDPKQAAADFVGRLEAIAELAGSEERVVSVVLDGENPWEFYAEGGRLFLEALFETIAASERIRARTFSSVLESGPDPAPLRSVRAGSWIRSDLTTWIGHEEKNRAWETLARTRSDLGGAIPDAAAGESLLAAEGSDWFWWYGDEHSSAHDAEFDRAFRLHLQNAWRLAGRDAPLSLGRPIARLAETSAVAPPTGPVTPVLDGRATDYFEWLTAGRAEAETGSGAMTRGGRLLRCLRFGADERELALRLDTFAEPAGEFLTGLVVVLEFASPREVRFRLPLRRGPGEAEGLRACLDRILEISIPFQRLGASSGARFEFRLVLEDEAGRRLEAVPDEGFISFTAGSELTDWLV